MWAAGRTCSQQSSCCWLSLGRLCQHMLGAWQHGVGAIHHADSGVRHSGGNWFGSAKIRQGHMASARGTWLTPYGTPLFAAHDRRASLGHTERPESLGSRCQASSVLLQDAAAHDSMFLGNSSEALGQNGALQQPLQTFCMCCSSLNGQWAGPFSHAWHSSQGPPHSGLVCSTLPGCHLTVRCLSCRLKEPDVQVACRNALHPLLLSLTSHSAACSSRFARGAQVLLYKAGGLYASMLRSMLQALLDFVSHGTWGTLCTAAFLWMCCLYVAACCYSLSRQTADKIETVVRLCGEAGVHRGDTAGLAVRLPQFGWWLSRGHTHSQFGRFQFMPVLVY